MNQLFPWSSHNLMTSLPVLNPLAAQQSSLEMRKNHGSSLTFLRPERYRSLNDLTTIFWHIRAGRQYDLSLICGFLSLEWRVPSWLVHWWITDRNFSSKLFTFFQAVSILRQAGVHAEASPGFEVLLLRKFAINCVANLLSIIVDTNCEGLCSNHWDRMQDLYKEFMTIAEQTHPNGCKELPDNFHAIVFNGLASYGKHFPSSKHDFNSGKPVEIGSLNGYLVHCGNELNIPVPHNSLLVREVEALVQKRDQKQNEKSTWFVY